MVSFCQTHEATLQSCGFLWYSAETESIRGWGVGGGGVSTENRDVWPETNLTENLELLKRLTQTHHMLEERMREE